MTNKIINKYFQINIGLTGNIILWLALLVTAIAIFVPFSPGLPADGLDASWVFGVNHATALGLSFGKEIIFTFGPYASIYTKAYSPSTDFMMVIGSLYLALLYWGYSLILMGGTQWRWVLIFYSTLAGLMYLRDPLFFSFPLLVGLVTYKILTSKDGEVAKGKFAPFHVALLFSPFGLLPLIKGSILILCGAIAILCSAFFIANRHRLLAIVCLISPLASMLIFWVASGQSVGILPNYFIGMVPLVSGYTEAMAINGEINEVIIYLIASAFLLLVISLNTNITRSSKIFLFFTYFVFLFISFKAGFVRHDGHALISGVSILIAGVLMPFVLSARMTLAAIIFVLISWSYIDSNYIKTSTDVYLNNLKLTYSSAWYGIKNRIENRNLLKVEYDIALNSLRKKASFPVLQGTTDIYSFNQSYLISSGNRWSPRPMFQSYSAYTSALAEANRKHLLGSRSPNNIIFKIEPIDGRVPSMEDGASWPTLMSNYRPTLMENDFLFLQKKGNISDIEEKFKLKSETHLFGEHVSLPHSSRPVFAEIEIKPTILGRIASIVFKPSQLQLTLELNNGMEKQYRIIAGMAKSGFVISPLIENTAEFGMLYGKEEFLHGKSVKSIVISSSDDRARLWKSEYAITFSQIKNDAPIDISYIYKFDRFDNELSGSTVVAKKCEGSIDLVNGVSPWSQNISASTLLKISGWLAVSVDKIVLPEAVYVVLTDIRGKHKYLRTHLVSRPDVGAHFKKPELNESGYSAIADISALEGQYSLGIAIKESNRIKICPEFKIPATITQ